MKSKFFAILNVAVLSVIIFGVSIFFINDQKLIGYILILLAFVCFASLVPFKVKFKSIRPDIWFGIIDNGILAIMAVVGAHFAGVAGAIIGGVVGNAITDGIAGVFEGNSAEKLRNNDIEDERTIVKSAVGKMAGCLLGAGVVLVFFSILGI